MTIPAIYEGNGILRLLNPPPELTVHQELEIEIVTADLLGGEDEEYNPSPEAVMQAMGLLRVGDRELARWLAESPEVSESNQWLYEEPH